MCRRQARRPARRSQVLGVQRPLQPACGGAGGAPSVCSPALPSRPASPSPRVCAHLKLFPSTTAPAGAHKFCAPSKVTSRSLHTAHRASLPPCSAGCVCSEAFLGIACPQASLRLPDPCLCVWCRVGGRAAGEEKEGSVGRELWQGGRSLRRGWGRV